MCDFDNYSSEYDEYEDDYEDAFEEAQSLVDDAADKLEEARSYSSSCLDDLNAKEREYDKAFEYRRKMEEYLRAAESIRNKFWAEFNEYHNDDILFNPGGEQFMRRMTTNEVSEIQKKLDRIQTLVDEYALVDTGLGNKSKSSVLVTGNSFWEIKRNRKEALEATRNKYARNRDSKMPNPNVLVRCKVCGRPMAICTCKPSETPDTMY